MSVLCILSAAGVSESHSCAVTCDETLETFSLSDSSGPDVFLLLPFDLVTELMGDIFLKKGEKKAFFDKIFVKRCFSPSAWCSTQQCLVALVLDGRNIWIILDADVHPAGRVKDALEFPKVAAVQL